MADFMQAYPVNGSSAYQWGSGPLASLAWGWNDVACNSTAAFMCKYLPGEAQHWQGKAGPCMHACSCLTCPSLLLLGCMVAKPARHSKQVLRLSKVVQAASSGY